MQLRYRLALPLIALSLVLAMSPALASKSAPVAVPIPGGALPQPTGTNGTSSVCALGQTSADAAYVWFFPSDDYYYTVFDPAACGCPNGQIQNLHAHWALFWQTPCQITVQAWILNAIQTGPGCYIPDTGPSPPDPTSFICTSAVVTLDGSAGGLINHDVPLPDCQCVGGGPKFVLFKIISSPGCPQNAGALTSPAIVVDATPDLCTSYNAFSGSGGPVDMIPGFGFPGNTTMWVEADCCGVTPTLPGSWGQIKTLYR